MFIVHVKLLHGQMNTVVCETLTWTVKSILVEHISRITGTIITPWEVETFVFTATITH